MAFFEANKKFFFPCEAESDCEELIESIINIYEHLGDEKSKSIFEKRLLYSFTNDYKYINQLVCDIEGGKRFLSKLESVKEKDIYIYGAGIKGSRLIQIFPDIQWAGYIDVSKQGGTYQGLNIYGLEKVEELQNNGFFVISVTMNPGMIKETLCSLGVCCENIIILKDYDSINEKNMYLDDEIIKLIDKDKIFADIGSFDGDDTLKYLKWCKDADAFAIAFEADVKNFKVCQERLESCKNVKVFNWGLGEKRETRRFSASNTVSSKLTENGNEIIQIYPLDEIRGEFGFLKIDVEGAEMEVLKGANKIISVQKPQIAISIYHKRDDIWKLPQLILETNPEYKFFLRHYTVGVTNTVLYAIP